jgi:hypothetical protein
MSSSAVIVAMLKTAPRRQRKSTAHSSTSGRPLRTHPSGAPQRPRARAFAGTIGEAYGRFFELPVPVVLVALWLLGAILLVGLVLGVVSLAAIALA